MSITFKEFQEIREFLLLNKLQERVISREELIQRMKAGEPVRWIPREMYLEDYSEVDKHVRDLFIGKEHNEGVYSDLFDMMGEGTVLESDDGDVTTYTYIGE